MRDEAALDDADGACCQLSALGCTEGARWGEVDQVVGPLADDLRVPDGTRSPAKDADPAVADLVAVAIGAVSRVGQFEILASTASAGLG